PSYKSSRSEKSTQEAHFLRVSSMDQIAALKEMFLPSERRRIEERLDNYDREIEPTGYTADGGLTTVCVRDVQVNDTTADVYSLEVQDSHNFVTTDGLVVHNCFPKDVDAVRALARNEGYEPELLDAVVGVNDKQPERMVELLEKHIDIRDARVAVLGLAFKPGTDDVRNSRALDVIDVLLRRNAEVVAYDPVAIENVRDDYPAVEYAGSGDEAVRGADAAVISTDWEEFEDIDFGAMERSIVVDGRRMNIDRSELEVYEGLCW
ncbi:MAG: UDP binding domain-containing protein, partial [Halobacteria archaeon]|nr:UDP binding domain-containing protein [Halobacteria archaeon]